MIVGWNNIVLIYLTSDNIYVDIFVYPQISAYILIRFFWYHVINFLSKHNITERNEYFLRANTNIWMFEWNKYEYYHTQTFKYYVGATWLYVGEKWLNVGAKWLNVGANWLIGRKFWILPQ